MTRTVPATPAIPETLSLARDAGAVTPLLDARDLAHLLGISLSSVYRRRSLGAPLPRAIKLGSSLRWRLPDVSEFIDAQLERT